MFPIGDDNSTRKSAPVVVDALIALNVACFFAELSVADLDFDAAPHFLRDRILEYRNAGNDVILMCRPGGADMATRLGFPDLATALAHAFTETLSADVPMALRRGDGGSFVVAPASHGLRWPVWLRRLLARLEGR